MSSDFRAPLVTFWRVIEIASFVLAALSFFAGMATGQYYLNSAPTQPQPQLGKTLDYRGHGQVVYITQQQNTFIHVCFIVALLSGGMFVFVEAYERPFRRVEKK